MFLAALCFVLLTKVYGNHASDSCACTLGQSHGQRFSEIAYTPSSEHLENPGRGFYEYSLTRASDFQPLTRSYLDWLRSEEGVTVVWRQYVLDTFVSSDIDVAFLTAVYADMDVLREAGFTTTLRFMYTHTLTDSAPYGDATKAWMFRHIEQVSPLLHDNEDVIDVLQAGFIGTWGEWYYTTYLGDPDFMDWGNPDWFRGYSPEVWADRAEILDALLQSAPDTMMVQFRYPTKKYYILDDTTPTTQQDMEARNKKSRIAHHNDCFVSSDTDVGTYWKYEEEYPYLQEDTKWTSYTGETCRPSDSDRHLCPTATKELEELHYDSLNQAYNRDVLNLWKDGGCYAEIHRRLGYRIQLNKAELPDSLELGGQFCFRIELQNVGYSAPTRNRNVAIVIRDTTSGDEYEAFIGGVNLRMWLPGSPIILESSINVPEDLPLGSYQVFLALKDEELTDLSDYNILLANAGVPVYREGLNDLFHVVAVSSGGGQNPECPSFATATPQRASNYDRLYCGYGGCSSCAAFPIENPSFEDEGGWQDFGVSGFQYTTETASHGSRSARVSNGGALQVWTFPQGTRSFQVSADSKNEGVTGEDSNNYSLYCDVKFYDGSWEYGVVEQFSVGNINWHSVTLTANFQQELSEAWCYGMFRDYNAGVAFFDNFQGWTSTGTIEGNCQ